MSNPLRQWGTAIASLLISCSALAQPEKSAYQVISINYAALESSGSYRVSPNANNPEVAVDAELEYSSEAGLALGWGIEQSSSRFMLEYYRSASEIEAAPFPATDATAERKLQSLFYSGYWVPNVYWGLKGILGAGVGYTEQTLNSSHEEMRERGWSYKISAGLEYAVFDHVSVYLLAENLYLGEVDDEISIPGGAGTAAVGATRTLDDGEQTRLGLGVNFRF